MKRYTFIIIAAMAMILTPVYSFAEDCGDLPCDGDITKTKASSDAFAQVNLGGGNGYSPFHVNVYKLDPAVANNVASVVLNVKGDDRLGSVFSGLGFQPVTGLQQNRGMTVASMQQRKVTKIKDEFFYTSEHPIIHKAGKDDKLVALPYFPAGANQIGWSKALTGKELKLFMPSSLKPILRGWEETGGNSTGIGAKYYTLLFTYGIVNDANVMGAGLGDAFGANFGPSSALARFVNTIAGSISGGKNRQKGWKEPMFLAVALDRGGPPPGQQSSQQKIVRVKVPDLLFEHDKYDIPESRYEVLLERTRIFELILKNLKNGQAIWIVGQASEVGPKNYNRKLSGDRAEEEYKLQRQLLAKFFGVPQSVLNSKFKYSFQGEEFPQNPEMAKQRRNIAIIAARL